MAAHHNTAENNKAAGWRCDAMSARCCGEMMVVRGGLVRSWHALVQCRVGVQCCGAKWSLGLCVKLNFNFVGESASDLCEKLIFDRKTRS